MPIVRVSFRKLTDFIRDHFINRVIKDIRQSSSVRNSSDPNLLAEFIPSVVQKQLESSVPILQSTYLIFKSCEELCGLVKCLPLYADEFCQAIVDLLFQHRESANKFFLSLVEPFLSFQWVKDADINRHLRTLPNFDEFLRSKKERRSRPIEPNPHRETKETETLLINYNTEEMFVDDICLNLKHVEYLGSIHESLDWLFDKLDFYFVNLDQALIDVKHLEALAPTVSITTSRSADPLKLSRLNLEIFSNALRTTLNLSHDVLILLHLEIRLHCFYHLSLLYRHTTPYAYRIDVDPDENIFALNRDLTNLFERLQTTLNESKLDYVFQGLPAVLSRSFIESMPRFHRLSESGATKMCRNIFSVEQTLAQIGIVADTDAQLTRASQFFDFVTNVKPEEILHLIEERGVDYSEQDYLHLIQLQHRSLPTNETFDLAKIETQIKNFFHPK